MKRGESIWSDAKTGMAIVLERKLGDDVLSLLQVTIWGSGRMRYRIVDLPAKLDQLRDPYVFVLLQDGELKSACILDRCSKCILERTFDAFHFVMIATAEESRSQGLAEFLAERIRGFCQQELKRPGMAFAYIEKTTEFSLRISKQVQHSIEANMDLVLFSRLWPRSGFDVGLLEEAERPGLVDRLTRLYCGHEMLDFDSTILTKRYHVLRRGSEIVAGVQAEVLNWSVISIPGLAGSVLMNLLPRLPHLNRVANPRGLRLLRFGNLLFEPGQDEALTALLETVLNRHDTALGLIMMDRKSPVLARVISEIPLGIFHRFVNASAQLHMDFVGVSEADIARIADRPIMVSAADVI